MSVILFGGQTCNGFMGLNYILNSTELTAIKSSDTNWTWGYNTFCLAKFNNDLKAGNISLDEVLTAWKVYRKNITNEDALYTAVGETSNASVHSVRDYMVGNANTYNYMIVGKTANYLSDAIYSENVTADFFYWTLVDINTHKEWKFQLSTNGNDIEGKYTVNNSVSIVTTHNKYPIFSIGKPQYISNTLTVLLGNIDANTCEYTNDTNKKMDDLVEFLNNGSEKILKTPRGRILKVFTSTTDFGVDNQTKEMEQTVTFTFTECGESNNINLFDELIL